MSIAFATPDRQSVRSILVARGVSVKAAIIASGILDDFPQIDLRHDRVGIYGKVVSLEAPVGDGDRIEIYRLLVVDPKQARRSRASAARKMRR